jgi:hypothetical protein
MKKTLLGLCIVMIGACSGNSTTPATTSTVATVPTTTVPVVTTTTLPAIVNPPSGEKIVDCDKKAISASYGEKLRLEFCTQTWAMGDTDKDTWNCSKEGCEQTRLYHLVDNKWESPAICYRNQPLTRFAISCYIPNMGPATLAEIPPQDVACLIWTTNRSLSFFQETGCTASKADIAAAMAITCDGHFEATSLPIEKCDRGQLVTVMQKKLRDAGYSMIVDGYFGPEMAKAVYAFQGKKGLTQLGIIDKPTWEALAGKPFPS